MVIALVVKKYVQKSAVCKLLSDHLWDYTIIETIKTKKGVRYMFVSTPSNCETLKMYDTTNKNNPKYIFYDVKDYIDLDIITLAGVKRTVLEEQLNETLGLCGVIYKVTPINWNGYLRFGVSIKLDETFNEEKLEAIMHKLGRLNYVGSINWE